MTPVFLVLNSGSSSLKFEVFDAKGNGEPRRILRGQFELDSKPRFKATNPEGEVIAQSRLCDGAGHQQALDHLLAWLREHGDAFSLAGVGHRVVHGGQNYCEPVKIDEPALAALERLVPLAPLHQPHNLEPIRILDRQYPRLVQIACFDTAFHQRQPQLARLFALPRSMSESGIRRYGFHGLSYAFLASVFGRYDELIAKGRVVAAHLGNGASLCAIENGASVATTMGFSALDGLPMGTRCGSLDPAVVLYLMRETKLSVDEVERLLYTQSGLLGVSGISNDMRELRAQASSQPSAQLAIDLFVYRICRELGSLIAALGGIDALVFTAGIGENDAATRAEVLRGSAWAGFELDPSANEKGGPKITRGSGPSAWVIPTDEELMIARAMRKMIGEVG
ncbi:MAG: acetate/propionate family kinase [Hyphomicrobiales bacterium]|nr:acetate/propionate family kinase [Hyphomicrobiales bacterium]